MFSGHVKNIKSQPQDTAVDLTTSDKITMQYLGELRENQIISTLKLKFYV